MNISQMFEKMDKLKSCHFWDNENGPFEFYKIEISVYEND